MLDLSLVRLGVFAALVSSGAVLAQQPPTPRAIAAATPASTDPFAQAMAARAVADFARRQNDTQAMIVAARMLQEVPFADKPGAAAADAGFSANGLFGEARTLAKGDPTMLMQINVAQSTGSRGVFASTFGKGLVRLVQDVAAQAAYRFDISAVGGQILRIGAIGDLGTSMVLRLADAAGRMVCVDNSGSYAPVCATTPTKAGRYRVEILNRSAVPSKTVILSN